MESTLKGDKNKETKGMNEIYLKIQKVDVIPKTVRMSAKPKDKRDNQS